jgi:hypothetical protein
MVLGVAREKGSMESREFNEMLLHGSGISSVLRRVVLRRPRCDRGLQFLEENSAYDLRYSPVSYQLAQSIEVH